jgi:hypothetical protein
LELVLCDHNKQAVHCLRERASGPKAKLGAGR